MASTFDELYPNIAWWAESGGWIEIGLEENTSSLVRVLDTGGTLWQSGDSYESVGAAMDEAEVFIGQWAEENGL